MEPKSEIRIFTYKKISRFAIFYKKFGYLDSKSIKLIVKTFLSPISVSISSKFSFNFFLF